MKNRNPGRYPTQSELREALRYNSKTGEFFWRVYKPGRKRSLKAGCPNGIGYLMIGMHNWVYNAHILAWIYVYGEKPEKGMDIDHVNGDVSDNCISNLRLGTHAQNLANAKQRTDSPHYKGVEGATKKGKYLARMRRNGKRYTLGTYDTPEEAHAAYCRAAKKHDGEFFRAR